MKAPHSVNTKCAISFGMLNMFLCLDVPTDLISDLCGKNAERATALLSLTSNARFLSRIQHGGTKMYIFVLLSDL